MKKIKLFLAAIAAMVSLGASAQDWTASEVETGDFYLLNVGSGEFFTKGNGWGTQASITTDGKASSALKLTFMDLDGIYKLVTNVNATGNGVEYLSSGTIYTDQSHDKNSAWKFEQVGSNANGPIYSICSAGSHGGGEGKYMTASADNTIVGPADNANSAYAQWQIVEESQTAAIYAEYVVKAAAKEYQAVRATIVAWTTSDAISNADEAKATFNTALEAADAKVEAATSVDEVNEAIAGLKAAGNTFLESVTIGGGLDITNAWITNPAPGISGNLNGWTNSGSPSLQAQLFEYWNVSAGTTKQTLKNLPKGAYKLTAIAYTRDNMTATLYAGENTVNLVGCGSVNDRNGGNTWIAANETNGRNNLNFTLDAAAESLEIGLIADDATGDHWMCWRSFTLTYYGDPINLAKINLAAAVEAANAIAEFTIPSGIYANLQTTISENNKTYTTVAEYEAATNAITTATAAAEALVSPFALAAKAFALYNQTNYSEKVDGAKAELLAVLATIDAETTAEGITAAIEAANLPSALQTFMGKITFSDNGFFEITDFFLVNADFSAGNINGWETNYVSGQQANNIGYQGASYSNGGVVISKFIEAWRPGATLGDGYLRQTVKGLPEGKYVLEADAIATWQNDDSRVITGAQLYITADGVDYKKDMSTKNAKPEHFSTEFLNTGEGDVIFGLRTVSANCNWMCADNFTVKFYGIDLAPYATNLANAVAEAKAIDQTTLNTGAKNALNAALETYNKEWSTSKEYATAISAIQTATSNALAVTAALAEFKQYGVTVAALKDIEGYTETVDGATTTFTTALGAAALAADAASTVAKVEELTEAVKAAGLTFLAGVRSDGAHPFDITFLIANPAFDDNNINGWTRTFDGGSANTRCHSNEFYDNNSFDFYQTLSDMPKGNYELKVQAFQRPGWADAAYDAYMAGNTSTDAVVYINDGETSVKHIAADAQNDHLYWENEGEYPDDSRVGAEGAYKYIPNSMEGAEVWFAAGHYDNSILTAVEGTLKLGFKADHKTASGTWTLFDNFRLYFYGQSINVTMDEEVAFSALADIEGANVTMARTTKVGFNTVALPFDLKSNQVKEVFGEGAVVYTFSENSADADDATVEFNTKAEQTIEANVPVLVKATAATSQIVASNVIVKTGEAKAEGANFDFVGNYGGEVTIAEGDWFIGNDAVYQSAGATKIKGFRAYMKDKTGGEATVKLFIDGIATSINAINGVEAENGAIFNLAGQRVNKAQKGIYIVNGKKVLVK